MDQKAKGDDSRALFMPLRKFLSAKKSLSTIARLSHHRKSNEACKSLPLKVTKIRQILNEFAKSLRSDVFHIKLQ